MSNSKATGVVFDVYLSGPISSHGKIADNLRAFGDAAKTLRQRGYRVFSPPENEPMGLGWSDYLRRDLRYLIDAGMVVALPGWTRSKGAKLEISIAKALGMQVVGYREFVGEAA